MRILAMPQRTAPVLPLDPAPAGPTPPDEARHRVPSAWFGAPIATFEFESGSAPYRQFGIDDDRFEMRVARSSTGSAPSWVRVDGPFHDAIDAANQLALDDTRAVGYGTPHAVFSDARDGAYYVAPLAWEHASTMPDGSVTLDVDEFGDPSRVPSAVTSSSSDLVAIVGASHWVDLRT
jgi:hypothetical protein